MQLVIAFMTSIFKPDLEECKMKKTSLLAALIIMTASSAMAQQWKYLGDYNGSTIYFYNPKTYSLKDYIAGSWIKKEFNVDTAAMLKNNIVPDMYVGNKSTVTFEEYDCAKRMMRTQVGKEYYKKDEHDIKRTGWLEIAPKSLDESLFNALCKDLIK